VTEDISELTFPTSSHSKHSKPRKCDQTMFERRLNCAEAAERQTVTPYLSLCSAPALAALTPPLARPYRSPLPTPTHHRPHAPSRRDHGPATSAPSVSRHLHPRTPPRTTSTPLGLTTHTPGCAHANTYTHADATVCVHIRARSLAHRAPASVLTYSLACVPTPLLHEGASAHGPLAPTVGGGASGHIDKPSHTPTLLLALTMPALAKSPSPHPRMQT
jgi:hypothetical protein